MTKIYSYILRIDDGAAPNPFGGVCTLTICKPAIRRNAQIGDWVIGTGSKHTKLNDSKVYDFSDSLVYAMKITDKQTLKEYDVFCNHKLTNKIPKWKTNDWRLRVGDCIYDYTLGDEPTIRKGVHNEIHRKRDLGGNFALLSVHFYYFGVEARFLPSELKGLIKRNQGHKKIENIELIEKFEEWIAQFKKNTLFADPQMRWKFDQKLTKEELLACTRVCSDTDEDEDEDEDEEILC